jgi:hypothetical protein
LGGTYEGMKERKDRGMDCEIRERELNFPSSLKHASFLHCETILPLITQNRMEESQFPFELKVSFLYLFLQPKFKFRMDETELAHTCLLSYPIGKLKIE